MLCKLLKLEEKEVDEELEHVNENNRKKFQIIKNDVLEKIINFYIEIIYNFLNVKNKSSERYLHNYLYTYITSACKTKIGTEDKISGHSGHYYLKIGNESFATFKPLFMAMVHAELLTRQRLEQIIAYHIKAKIKEYINATAAETKNYFFYLIFENKELKAAIKEKTTRVIDEMLEEMNLDSYFIQNGHPAITVMNNSEYESYEELPEALQKVLDSKFIENLEITCKELFPDFEIREFEGRNIWLVYGREPDLLDFQLNFGNDRKMALLKYELWQKMKYPLYPLKFSENQESIKELKEKFKELTKSTHQIDNLKFFQTGMQTLKMRDFLDNLAVAKYCTEYNIFYLIP